MYTQFTDWIQRTMESYGISNTALADKLEVQQSTVSMWRSGQKRPSETNCFALARFFEVNPDDLLEWAGYERRDDPAVAEEQEFLATIRRLDESTRKTVLEMLKGLLERKKRISN